MLKKDIEDKKVKHIIYRSMKRTYKTINNLLGYQIYSTKYKHRGVPKIISDDRKFIYVVNPLVASRSIIGFLKSEIDHIDGSNVSRKKLSKILAKKEDKRKYTLFSLCRSPWKRVISCYNKKILNANNIKKIGVLAQYEGLLPQMGFESFANWLCSPEGSDEKADPHWVSQTEILFSNGGEPLLDEIVRLENIDSEFESLCDRLGISFNGLRKCASSQDQLHPPPYDKTEEYYRSLSRKPLQCHHYTCTRLPRAYRILT